MFWNKKKAEPYVYTWESEPFVFQKGMVYVIEVDVNAGISLEEVKSLDTFFQEQGVIVKLVLVRNTRNGSSALNPIKVKRKKEQQV